MGSLASVGQKDLLRHTLQFHFCMTGAIQLYNILYKM